jgi:hypothetical protein
VAEKLVSEITAHSNTSLVEIDKSTNGLKYLNGQGGVFRLFSGQKMIKGDTGFSELQRVGLVQFRAAVQLCAHDGVIPAW